MRDFVLYATIVINLLATFGMIAGILMHSGRGGGLSDMFGGGGGAALGSTSAERNLTRITTVLMMVWVMTVVALGFLLVRNRACDIVRVSNTSKWRNRYTR